MQRKLLFVLLCVLSSMFGAKAQASRPDSTTRFKYTIKAVAFKLPFIVNGYYAAGVEFTNKNFDDYFIEYVYVKTSAFSYHFKSTRHTVELGFHKALERKTFPFYSNFALLYSHVSDSSGSEISEYKYSTNSIGKIGIGVGFGKKIRILKQFRLDITTGLRYFIKDRVNKIEYHDTSVKHRFLPLTYGLEPMMKLRFTFSFSKTR